MSRAAGELRTFLADRDVPCPGCAYNLRGLTTAVCPECGSALTVDGIRRSLRMRGGAPVVLAGIGVLMFALMALPAAAFVMLMSAGMMMGSVAGRGGESAAIVLGLGITGVLLFLGPLAVASAWDRWEARVAAMPRMVRWGIAGLCWSWLIVPAGMTLVMGAL